MKLIQNKVSKGVLWSAIDRFSVQGVQFIISIILARILTPSDFGLIALALIFLNILQTINDVGFGAALIHKQDRDDLDFSTIFVFNLTLGVILYTIVYFTAPIIADFFQHSRLSSLIRLLGLNLIITSFNIVQRTKLIIDVDFKTQAQGSLMATVISGCIGITCALKGFGVYSLVFQSLFSNIINVTFLWFKVVWRPSFIFSYKRFITLFSFAYKLVLARLVNNVFRELYSALIGKSFSSDLLGFYNRSNSFLHIGSSNIVSIVQRVSIPVFCKKQDNLKEMQTSLLNFTKQTAMIVCPLICGVFVLAEPLVIVLLTDKWIMSAHILKILAPTGLCYLLSAFNVNIFNATGRTDLALLSEIVKKTLSIIVILICSNWGFYFFLLGIVINSSIELIVDLYLTKKQIGLPIYRQLSNLFRICLASLLMAFITSFIIGFFDLNIVKLSLGVLIGMVSYSLCCVILGVVSLKNVYNEFS